MFTFSSSQSFRTFLVDHRAFEEQLPEAIQEGLARILEDNRDLFSQYLYEHGEKKELVGGLQPLVEKMIARLENELLYRETKEEITEDDRVRWMNLYRDVYGAFVQKMRKRKTVMVLTFYAGNGHRSASRGVVAGFQQYHGLDVRVVEKDISMDLLAVYEPAVTYTPSLYKWFFRSTDKEELSSLLHGASYSISSRMLQDLVDEVEPDMIVGTICFYGLGHWIDRVLRKKFPHFPFYLIVTDSITIHQSWIAPGVDGYIVANEDSRQAMIKKHVPEERIYPLGFPVHPDFYQTHSAEQDRAALGVSQGELLFLVIANTGATWNDISFLQAFEQAFSSNVKCVVILGKNEKLLTRLQKSNLGKRVIIKGWVNDMYKYMDMADVVVTKAGGASVMECVALRKPMIIYKVLPGQEEGNAELIRKNNIGIVMNEGESLLDVMERYVVQSDLVLKQKEAFDHVTIPLATKKIVDFFFDKL